MADHGQDRVRPQPRTLLHRLYPSIASMREAIVGLAGPYGLREHLETSLSQPGDPAAYTETLLQHTLVWLPPSAAPLPQRLTLQQHSSQAEVLKRAVEVLVRSSAKSSNLLCLGFAKGMHGAEQRSANTTTPTLCAPPWPLLLSRLGDVLMLYLLLHACIFVPLPNRCYLQVAGPPVAQRVWAQWRANLGRPPPARSAPAPPAPAPLRDLPVLTQNDDMGGDALLAPVQAGVPATQAAQASSAWECGAMAAGPEQPASLGLSGRRAQRSARQSSWQRRRAATRRAARQAGAAQGLGSPGAAPAAASAAAGERCGGLPMRPEGCDWGDVNPAPAGKLGMQNPGHNASEVAVGSTGASRRRGPPGGATGEPVGRAPRGWVPPAEDALQRWRMFYCTSFRGSPGLPKGRAHPAV